MENGKWKMENGDLAQGMVVVLYLKSGLCGVTLEGFISMSYGEIVVFLSAA